MSINIRLAEKSDRPAIWSIMEPIIRAGETYPLPRNMTDKAALAYWCSSLHTTLVAEDKTGIVGTYYVRPNNSGGGDHIANCGYMVHPNAQGKGVARTMCTHSLQHARNAGYKGVQLNFVIAGNAPAVGLWTSLGFKTIGTLPEVFNHPTHGYVDAHIMFQAL